MVWRQVAREADEAGIDVLQRQDLSFGAYILSLTGRVAGCRGPRLSCNAVAEAWFFRSWAVVLRSYRLTRARDCRSTRSTPSGPCSELLAMSPLPLTPSFTRAIGSTLNVVVVGDNRIGMLQSCSQHKYDNTTCQDGVITFSASPRCGCHMPFTPQPGSTSFAGKHVNCAFPFPAGCPNCRV